MKNVLLKIGGGMVAQPTLVLRCMLDVIGSHNPMLAQTIAAGLYNDLLAGDKGSRTIDEIAKLLGVDADALVEACHNRVVEKGKFLGASEAKH